MLLSGVITAFETKATELGYTFVSGSLKDVIDVASNAMDKFIWLDRPVTGAMNSKLLRTKSGQVSYTLNVHSLQPYYQELEATTPKQTIYDDHVTRLINFLGGVHIDNISIAKALQDSNNIIFEHAVHEGKYIGVLITLNYKLDYCE